MEPTKELIDGIDRDRIARARQMSSGAKFLAGGDLFDDVCERMRAGIRSQFPHEDDVGVNRILKERLARLRQVEEYGIYQPAGTLDEQQ